MKTTRHVAAALATLAIGLGAYLTFQSVELPHSAPVVAYTLLNGQKASTDQLHGKVVLVNFWATTCTTCMHEMPQIAAMHERFKARGYETLSVAMSYDAPANVIHYAESRKLPFDVAIDNLGAIARSFGNVENTPTSILINKRGDIVKRFVGEPDFAALNATIESLLAEV